MRVSGVPYIQGRNAYSDPDGTKYAIAIHNTSNNASAEAEASYATRRTDGISAHFYVDSDSIIQSLDTASRAGHAGSANGNNHAIAVEITGVNSWTRTQWLTNVAWSKLGAALAQVVRFYGISVRRATVADMQSNPRVRAFYGHDDMRRAWGGTTHTDPGPNFPWDKLFEAVNATLHGSGTEEDVALTNEDVQKIWTWDLINGPNVGQAYELIIKLVADVEELKARPPVQATPVDVPTLVAALSSPEVAEVLNKAAFFGAQRAESE